MTPTLRRGLLFVETVQLYSGNFIDFLRRRLDSWPFTRLLLSKKIVQKNSGKGNPPPQIRAMPELKRFYGFDCFPKNDSKNRKIAQK